MSGEQTEFWDTSSIWLDSMTNLHMHKSGMHVMNDMWNVQSCTCSKIQRKSQVTEATVYRGRSELHSGSDQFLGLLGTLCYKLSWLIGPEQEVFTGDQELFSHQPSSHAESCSAEFTGQSCRELTVRIQRWQLYSHIDKKLLLLQMVKSHFAPCVLRSLPLLLHVCPIWSNIWEESGFVWDGRRHVDFVFYGGFISNFMTI